MPATSLTDMCYSSMFSGCRNIDYVKCFAVENIGINNTAAWLMNTSPTGTFVKASEAEWPTGNSGIPENWVVQSM